MIVTTGGMLRALVVDWESPSNPGGIITTYMVTYDNTTVDTGDINTKFVIMGLDVFTSYTINVIACTDNGCGNQSDVVIGTTEEEGMCICNAILSHVEQSTIIDQLIVLLIYKCLINGYKQLTQLM